MHVGEIATTTWKWIEENATPLTLVGVVIGLIDRILKLCRDRGDSKRIYDFLLTSQSNTNYTFRSTESISSATKIPEGRVEVLCSRHPKIRRNEKEKQTWKIIP
jgi:hypothetical protein